MHVTCTLILVPFNELLYDNCVFTLPPKEEMEGFWRAEAVLYFFCIFLWVWKALNTLRYSIIPDELNKM